MMARRPTLERSAPSPNPQRDRRESDDVSGPPTAQEISLRVQGQSCQTKLRLSKHLLMVVNPSAPPFALHRVTASGCRCGTFGFICDPHAHFV